MITRTALKAEIDRLKDADLDIVYSIIQSILRQYDQTEKQMFLSRLQNIRIEGPPDFSRKIEEYLKQVESNASTVKELATGMESFREL
ncbi:hypothetical protein U14_00638 [Candidatus Moduliflexus flocculans]|uniref:Uncharacterized protein n=1 Tax=Candidatus Moduliflexus flocculans TaxID=1499966 RepID=A0A0S6VQC6_9BACT|nr:hypothetical protein U14_00638 [Candidatus Moduliflexus flocculans]